jgi:hypothetical protein
MIQPVVSAEDKDRCDAASSGTLRTATKTTPSESAAPIGCNALLSFLSPALSGVSGKIRRTLTISTSTDRAAHAYPGLEGTHTSDRARRSVGHRWG